jgi:murein L,D-transpeptidase YcbB/YkuD
MLRWLAHVSACATAAMLLTSPSGAPAGLAQAPERTTEGQAVELPARIAADLAGGNMVARQRAPRLRAQLSALYRPNGDRPVWLDDAGRPLRAVGEGLTLLPHADDDALDPADYDPHTLAQMATRLALPGRPTADQAAFDVALSAAMLAYLHDLHFGRLDPRVVGYQLPPRPDRHDLPDLLSRAVADGKLAALAAALRPQLAQYRLLRGVLPRYRALALARDPDYLTRQNMELVRGAGPDALVVAQTPEALAELAAGSLRLRQRPGPDNALGLIKFEMPNREDVYLHGTPAYALFSKSRRDFSHGCVRVADPAALAAWALAAQSAWTREAIAGAMNGSRTVRVRIERPIQVLLFYTTAAVMPEDGTIRFAEDIYRHDRRLDRALRASRGSR